VHFLALEFIKDAIYNFGSKGAGRSHGQLKHSFPVGFPEVLQLR